MSTRHTHSIKHTFNASILHCIIYIVYLYGGVCMHCMYMMMIVLFVAHGLNKNNAHTHTLAQSLSHTNTLMQLTLNDERSLFGILLYTIFVIRFASFAPAEKLNKHSRLFNFYLPLTHTSIGFNYWHTTHTHTLAYILSLPPPSPLIQNLRQTNYDLRDSLVVVWFTVKFHSTHGERGASYNIPLPPSSEW